MQSPLNALNPASAECVLVGLEEGSWCFSSSLLVRAAGFSFELLEQLRPSAHLAPLSEALIAREAALARRLAELDQQVEAVLAPIVQAARSGQISREEARDATRTHRHEVARLKAGEDVQLTHSDLKAIGAAVLAARQEHARCREQLQQEVDSEGRRLRAQLRTAVDERLLRAILWQNPEAFRNAVLPWIEGREANAKKARERDQLMLSLLQRYCFKNDTIGFFGPINWARFVTDGDGTLPLSCTDVEGLLTSEVFFEDWAMTEFIASVTADDRFLGIKAPRRAPHISCRDGVLRFPGGHQVTLSELEARLWEGCNGRSTVSAVVNRLLKNPFLQTTREQIMQALMEMRDKRWLQVSLPVPTREARADRWLIDYLGRIPASDQTRELADLVGQLVVARDRLNSAKDLQSLAESQVALSELFHRLGGQRSTRLAGSHYAGRTLAYQDCLSARKIEISLSRHREIFRSLDIVMHCAGWFIDAIWALVRTDLQQRFDEMAPNGQPVCLADFWPQTEALFFGEELDLSGIETRLQQQLAECLAISPQADGTYCLKAVEKGVRERFLARADGWGSATIICPDLLLAVQEAMGRAEPSPYAAVLGEIHIGGLTLCTNGFTGLSSHGLELVRMRDRILGGRRVATVLNGIEGGRPIRTQWREAAGTTEILFSYGANPDDGNPCHAIADLWVRPAGGGDTSLIVTGNGVSFSMEEIFGDFLFARIANAFKLGTASAHQARVTVGPLVWVRESWRVPVEAFAQAAAAAPADALLELSRIRSEWQLPQQVFVKLKGEPKPVFVDLVSPLFIGLFQSMLRRQLSADPSTLVLFSEVLPAMDRLWLADQASGRAYTSELRLAAFPKRQLPPAVSDRLVQC